MSKLGLGDKKRARYAEVVKRYADPPQESAEAPAHFSERLALLPGPTHAFNYEADRLEPTTSWTRALSESCPPRHMRTSP